MTDSRPSGRLPLQPGPGQWLGQRFELRELLGRGGFAVVYRAWDAARRVEVALKVLERTQSRDQARFAREAEALARLRHPNIVAVHETGVADGRPFIVEELIAGSNLATLAKPHGLPPATAAILLRDVAEAIEHAHSQGVLHRDLKPENVVVDAKGRPHVIDFGIASLADGAGPSLTVPGTIVGTPGFVAPEQLQGTPASPASDIYALGATLHEALCGKPPFHDQDDPLIAPLRADATPPSGLAPRVPPALDAIVLRCLARSPDARYPTARALARALDAFLDPALDRAARSPASPRRRVVVAVAVVAAVVVVAALALHASTSPRPAVVAPPPPVQPLAALPAPPVAQRAATRLEALLAAPTLDHDAIRALLPASRDDLDVRAIGARSSPVLVARAWSLAHAGGPFSEEVVDLMVLATDLAVSDAEAQARAQLAVADYLLRHGRADRALDAARLVRSPGRLDLEARQLVASALRFLRRKDEANDVNRSLAAEDPDGAVGLVAATSIPFDDWNYVASNALAERALALEPDNRRALAMLATGLSFRREADRALTLIERGLAVAPDDAQLHFVAGLVHMNRRDTVAASGAFTRAMELVAPLPYVQAVKWRGIALLRGGRSHDALPDLEEANRLRPDDADLLLHRGQALWAIGERQRAEVDWRRANEIDATFVRRRLGDFHPDVRQRILDAVNRRGQ